MLFYHKNAIMVSMDGIKSAFRKISYKIRHDFFSIENIALSIAIILCLVWTYQSMEAMARNWKLQEILTSEKKELELLTVEVEALELENDYYETQEYQELLARKYLDKKLPGENMVVMPENSDMAKIKHQEVTVELNNNKRTNLEEWMDFLFPDF